MLYSACHLLYQGVNYLPTKDLFYDEIMLLIILHSKKIHLYFTSPTLVLVLPQNKRNNTAVVNSRDFEIRSVLISNVSLNKMLNLPKVPVLDNNTKIIPIIP